MEQLCASCGELSVNSTTFCSHCGALLSASSDERDVAVSDVEAPFEEEDAPSELPVAGDGTEPIRSGPGPVAISLGLLVMAAALLVTVGLIKGEDEAAKGAKEAKGPSRSATEEPALPKTETRSDPASKEESRPAPVTKKAPEPEVKGCQGTTVLCFDACHSPDTCKELRIKETEEPLRRAIEAFNNIERKTLKTLHKGTWKTAGVDEPFVALVAAIESAREAGATISDNLTAIDDVAQQVQRLDTHNRNPPVAPTPPSMAYPEHEKPEYTGAWHFSGRYEGPMDQGGIIVRRRGEYYHVENYAGPDYYYKIPIHGYVRTTGRTTTVNFGGWETHYATVLRLVDKWVYKSEKSAHRELVRELKAT